MLLPGTSHPEFEGPRGGNPDFRTSLSTPTLSTFHSVSNTALVAKYGLDRVNDPREFDKTAEITRVLTSAKIQQLSNTRRLRSGTCKLGGCSEGRERVEYREELDKITRNEDSRREKGKGKTKERPNCKRRYQGMRSQ
jgi:hypothetical protein